MEARAPSRGLEDNPVTDTVVPLFPTPPPRGPLPDWRVVSLLEDLLAEAKAGRVRTCAVAMLTTSPDEATLRPLLRWVDEPDHAMALSGLAAKMSRDIMEE